MIGTVTRVLTFPESKLGELRYNRLYFSLTCFQCELSNDNLKDRYSHAYLHYLLYHAVLVTCTLRILYVVVPDGPGEPADPSI